MKSKHTQLFQTWRFNLGNATALRGLDKTKARERVALCPQQERDSFCVKYGRMLPPILRLVTSSNSCLVMFGGYTKIFEVDSVGAS